MKPQGGIFIDRYSDSKAVDIQYTIVADDLALYKLELQNPLVNVSGTDNISKIEVDVHRRWVWGG